MTVDSAGDVYVSDIRTFSPDPIGDHVLEFPANGGAPITIAVNLSRPWAVAADGAGNLYVATDDGILEFTPAGVQTVVYYNPRERTFGLAIDGAGNLFSDTYKFDTSTHRLDKFPSGGGPKIALSQTFTSVGSIAADAAGNVFVADTSSAKIFEIPIDGSPMITLAENQYASAMSVDGSGNLYTFNNVVSVIPVGGGQPFTIDIYSTYHNGGNNMAVDPDGNLLFTQQNAYVKLLRSGPPPVLSFATTNVGSTSNDSPQSFQIYNSGNQPLVVSNINIGPSFTQELNSARSLIAVAAATSGLAVSFMSITPGLHSFRHLRNPRGTRHLQHSGNPGR